MLRPISNLRELFRSNQLSDIDKSQLITVMKAEQTRIEKTKPSVVLKELFIEYIYNAFQIRVESETYKNEFKQNMELLQKEIEVLDDLSQFKTKTSLFLIEAIRDNSQDFIAAKQFMEILLVLQTIDKFAKNQNIGNLLQCFKLEEKELFLRESQEKLAQYDPFIYTFNEAKSTYVLRQFYSFEEFFYQREKGMMSDN
jgi:hypothetical protein